MKHLSILKRETIELLNIKDDGIYIDGTLGRGGHSEEILKRLDKGKLYAFDLDATAIKESALNLSAYEDKLQLIKDNYKNMFKYVNKVDGILLDLGVSSPQFDDPKRGFSYRFNEDLDMRMDVSGNLKASDILNNYSLADLCRIFRDYGEEKYAYQIAREIVNRRPIFKTFELVDIIKSVLPNKELKKTGHPAKKVFQALRIEVNQELENLKEFLSAFPKHLNKDARVVIISFHSLEDRLVKNCFKELSKDKDNHLFIVKDDEIEKARFELLNKKIIRSSSSELADNHRAKSAKLRGIRFKG